MKVIDVNQILEKNKVLISIFTGSRKSEIDLNTYHFTIKLMNKKYRIFLCIPCKKIFRFIQSYIKK